MEKLILVDGNNLLFRSYYATAYSGNFMKNSKGFPTNALFGFTGMINKIVYEEKPTYMIVAFDKGKTFRHHLYEGYKGGRIETPDELKLQFPLAKELLGYMGIKYYECDNYEADDIIGTFANIVEKDSNFTGTIVSSDKDLLQLISSSVDIKLLKQKDYIRYNEESFKEAYGINPINVIDLKALMGDASDNIPGVAGVGEKTALKLLNQYKTLDGIYNNIDSINGKLKEKLVNDKDSAYFSYKLATIEKNIPLDITLSDLRVKERDTNKLKEFYEELEFYSFIKKEEENIQKNDDSVDYIIVNNENEIHLDKDSSIYLEIKGTNYHEPYIYGLSIYNENVCYFIKPELIDKCFPKFKDFVKFTYDLKKLYVSFKWMNLDIENIEFDTMIAGYLLEFNIKDDISYLANQFNYNIPFYENTYMSTKTKYKEVSIDEIAKVCSQKAKFIYDTTVEFKKLLKEKELENLFYDIEMPLSLVLGDMEFDGVYVDKQELENRGCDLKVKIDSLEQEIYSLAGEKFNIASPMQLGNILFEKLGLPHSKKIRQGYSTSADILEKIKDKHPIVEKILDYRTFSKLYTTYVEGLINVIRSDGKIHTIFTQTLTRTGRLSSIEPNLQNIPIRYEEGKSIRKAFIPSENSVIVSGDYSQIELRLLSHIAHVDKMIEAFNNNEDIHKETAEEIFGHENITDNERRIAKAVNFGIIYGISGFGLSENIGVSTKEARMFIDNYLNSYPGIKEYMEKTIDTAKRDGYVKTMMGRIRTIPEINNTNYLIRTGGERIALNTPIQGTSADIIKKAMVNISRRFKAENIKSKMILQVHDELIFDCLKDELDKVIEIAKYEMENVVKLSVPLKVDFEYGDNWFLAK